MPTGKTFTERLKQQTSSPQIWIALSLLNLTSIVMFKIKIKELLGCFYLFIYVQHLYSCLFYKKLWAAPSSGCLVFFPFSRRALIQVLWISHMLAKIINAIDMFYDAENQQMMIRMLAFDPCTPSGPWSPGTPWGPC